MIKRQHLLPVLAVAAVFALPSGARADLMTACAADIGQHCADVDRGRGRIAACLAGHVTDLMPVCRPEVQAATNSRFVPGHVRQIFDPSFRAEIPAVCKPAAASLCPSVTPGDGRMFACLYARTDRVAPNCSAQAEAVLRAN